MSAPPPEAPIAVRVRADNGTVRDDGWVRGASRPPLRRLGEGISIAVGGTAIGVLLLPIPLIHLFGIVFGVASWGLGIQRVRSDRVVVAAGGSCPRCGQAGEYFVGFGRRRFRLPIDTSCPHCSHGLSLEPLPAGSPARHGATRKLDEPVRH